MPLHHDRRATQHWAESALPRSGRPKGDDDRSTRSESALVQDISEDWPFPTQETLETASREKATALARALLNRALDTGRAVAFIGSGASMAYGRISWNDLILNAQHDVIGRYEMLDAQDRRRLDVAWKRLNDIRIKPGERGDSSLFPAIYQACEQLDRPILELEIRGGGDPRSLREKTADLVRSDVGHARELLLKAVQPTTGRKGARNSVVKRWDEAKIRTFFVPERLEALLADPLCAERFPAFLRYRKIDRNAVDACALPVRRYLHAALLRMAESRGAILKAFEKVKTSEGGVRDLPFERSPLAIVLDRLRISRFLTTNYDHEIERTLKQQGYSVDCDWDPRHEFRQGTSGTPNALATDLSIAKSSRLLAFCCRDRGKERGPMAEVIHLHGQAGTPGDMTLVDDDYRRKYLSLGTFRKVANDAQRMALSANPIIFIGFGMTEDDVLRPLREFVGNRDRSPERIALALMPDFDAQRTLRERIVLPQRYGVLPLHYGSVSMFAPDVDPEAKDKRRIPDWLQHLWRLRAAALDLLTKLKESKAGGTPDADTVKQGRQQLKAALAKFPAEARDAAGKALLVPQRIEGIWVERPEGRDLSIAADLAVINDVVRFLASAADDALSDEDALRSMTIALEGAFDAVVSSFLCARLLKARVNRDEWRESWMRIPEPRAVRHDCHEGDGGVPVVSRHMLDLPLLSKEDESRMRFYRSAPSRMLDILLRSIEDSSEMIARVTTRRTFLLVARRGVGKGHFFSSLGDRGEGSPNSPLRRIWSLINGPGQTTDRAAFYNLSFSNEIGSVFDGLIAEMVHFLRANLSTGDLDRFPRDLDSLRNDRIGRLNLCIERLRGLADHPKRLFIAINGLSNLFDIDGKPKNGQIAKIVDLLFDVDATSIPVDFFLIVSERNVPAIFRRRSVFHLKRPDMDDRSMQDVQRRLSQMGMVASQDLPPAADAVFVHVLHESLSSLIGLSFFPAASLLMARNLLQLPGFRPQDMADQVYNVLTPTWERRIQASVHALLRNEAVFQSSKELVPQIILGLTIAVLRGDDPERCLGDLRDSLDLVDREAGLKALTSVIHGTVGGSYELDRFREASVALDRHFQYLHRQVGGGRYTLTLMMASSSEHFVDYEGNGERLARRDFDAAAERLQRYQARVLNDIRIPSDRSGDDIVIDHALRRMRRRYFEAKPNPEPGTARDGGTASYWAKAGEAHALLESIVWHLAAIGQPVAADVLENCPILKEHAERVRGTAFATAWACVEDHLQRLVRRGFAFQISDTDPRGGRRTQYAIHRLLQRQVFRSLGAPFVEYPYADQFTITMFATQPNDLPTLEFKAHKELWRTVASLIHFRKGLGRESLDGNALDLEARRLRAAFGILRSIYSVAVIARFPQTHALNEQDGELGVVESHRQIVRWLTRQAIELDDRIAELPSGKSGREYHAFYAEDIAWLFNECGVLSYMQGRLSDASFTLELARRAAETNLEPSESGPIRVRIALNRAAVEIDAGRATRTGSETSASLAVILSLPHEHEVPKAIASGYQALIRHLRGDKEAASKEYVAVVDGLREMKRSRAASIFSRHHADLRRSMGDFDQAHQLIEDSIRFALDGGHEDVRYDALMAKLRIPYSSKNRTWRNDTIFGEMERTRTGLVAIERYAQIMGLPKLTVDALILKARLQLISGDLDRSVEDATAAVQLATLNDMRLRKLSAILVLSQIYSRRDGFLGAPLTDLARDLAKRYEATAARAHVDSLLDGI